jgi:hypothetical protein
VYMIESQVTYLLDCLHQMRQQHAQSVEVRADVQEAFEQEMQRRMQGTVWTSGCNSWYLSADGRNTTLWPGFTFDFRHRTRHFDSSNYQLSPVPVKAQ